MILMLDTLIKNISKTTREYEKTMNQQLRKRSGSYFTDLQLAISMVEELMNNIDKPIIECRFLEPCVGTGHFVFAYLLLCYRMNLTKDEYEKIINNIYVSDTNNDTLNVFKKMYKDVVKTLFDLDVDDKYFKKHLSNGLIINLDSKTSNYISINNSFESDMFERTFDMVVTNPPYKNLKAEKKNYEDESLYLFDKKKYEEIGELVKNNFKYTGKGVQNIYKLFVEEIVEKYISNYGYAYLLIPSSILSDKNCKDLRTHLIFNYKIISIRKIAESDSCVDASQALCAILLKKAERTEKINISDYSISKKKNNLVVDINDCIDEKTGNSIVLLSKKEFDIRKKLQTYPKISELTFIKNLRGELDMSLNNSNIIKTQSAFTLIRGRNIGFYQLQNMNCVDYVDECFVKKTAKQKYIVEDRLACQQIANMGNKKRLKFTLIPKNFVLGNSCNFIVVEPNDYDVDLLFMLGILNSNLIEWFFKLTSSNNHVNNYEIDNLPIPINYKDKKIISSLVNKYITTKDDLILDEINEYVNDAYGI